GYSANHIMYGAERERWAKQAYSIPPAETISLEISAVQQGGNKRKGSHRLSFGVCMHIVPIENICEGKKDIDVQIDAPQLITLALKMVRSKILAFAPGFPWHEDEFIICDGGWVDLSNHPPNLAYFYKQCVQPS
ncbi:hypothetical protein CY34DRAFT_47153, partial [Suillus luteus UH-Slu-Lm8-n1]